MEEVEGLAEVTEEGSVGDLVVEDFAAGALGEGIAGERGAAAGCAPAHLIRMRLLALGAAVNSAVQATAWRTRATASVTVTAAAMAIDTATTLAAATVVATVLATADMAAGVTPVSGPGLTTGIGATHTITITATPIRTRTIITIRMHHPIMIKAAWS